MKILVTGNKGYIGSVLCKRLLQEGFAVIGLDTDFYNGCDFLDLGYSITHLQKDIRYVSNEDLSGVNAIVHLAALSNDPMGALNPQLTADINYRASVNLAKRAKENGVERFIVSSSCSIYGKSGEKTIDETGILDPLTAYAKSKVDSEREIARLADTSFSPIFMRNATVYGVSPMLRVDLVVNNLVSWAHTTGEIKIMSDGSPWRPLIHVQDICSAFIAVLKAPRTLIHNETFNVGQDKENYQIKDIADTIKNIMPTCTIAYTKEHGSDSRTYRVNFTKIKTILGAYFNPCWDIEKGINELFCVFRNKSFSENDFQGDKFTRLKRIKRLLSENKIDENLLWRGE